MHVLFIEVDTESAWAVASLGPAFIAPYLERHGHRCTFLRAKVAEGEAAVVERVRECAPDVIGLSLTTRQWQRARRLVRAVRAVVDVPVVAGGLHPTFSPREVLAEPGFDFVCLGEGEQAMLELVDALEAGEPADAIANMWKDGAAHPGMRPPFEPLDDLPFMDRAFLDEMPGVVHMATQRGCPFRCTYCAARMYNELYAAQDADYGRRRGHENVLAELRGLRERGLLSYVLFLDDTFTIHHPWVREFCRVYGEEIAAPFSLHARVETVNAEMLQQLAAAGCRHITYGVESGSDRVRREIMQRPVSNQRFRDVFRWTEEAGILPTANYMLGLPGETRDDLQQTLDLARELGVADFGYFVFYPYPGTSLFRVCRDRGYLPDDYLDREANHRTTVLDLPDLTQADIDEYYERFTALRESLYAERARRTGTDRAAATAHVRETAARG